MVVSGDEDAVLRVGRHFEAEGRRVSRLRVSHAFHSPRMEEMLEPLGQVVQGMKLGRLTVPIISNVTGAPAEHDELTTAEYWVQHARKTVRFTSGSNARASRYRRFLEVGPQVLSFRRGAGERRKRRKEARGCGLRCARSATRSVRS